MELNKNVNDILHANQLTYVINYVYKIGEFVCSILYN